MDIEQESRSHISVVLTRVFDVYFSRHSLHHIRQEDHSSIDVAITYGQNLIFGDHAVDDLDMRRTSTMTVSFKHSAGTLQMASNAFLNVRQGK